MNYNLDLLNDSGIVDYLVRQFNHPEPIILFGSFSKAEDIPLSDIDLLVVSPSKKEIDLGSFERNLNHKVQLFVKAGDDIKKMKNRELLNQWVNGIVLYGFLEMFK